MKHSTPKKIQLRFEMEDGAFKLQKKLNTYLEGSLFKKHYKKSKDTYMDEKAFKNYLRDSEKFLCNFS